MLGGDMLGLGSPFKRLYVFVLKRVLGRFMKTELNPQQLDVGLVAGTVTLRSIELNEEALNEVLGNWGATNSLPIKAQAGFVGCIELTIPWSDLLGGQIKVEITDLTIIFGSSSRDSDTSFGRSSLAESLLLDQYVTEFPLDAEEDVGHGFGEDLLGRLRLVVHGATLRYEYESPASKMEAQIILDIPFLDIDDLGDHPKPKTRAGSAQPVSADPPAGPSGPARGALAGAEPRGDAPRRSQQKGWGSQQAGGPWRSSSNGNREPPRVRPRVPPPPPTKVCRFGPITLQVVHNGAIKDPGRGRSQSLGDSFALQKAAASDAPGLDASRAAFGAAGDERDTLLVIGQSESNVVLLRRKSEAEGWNELDVSLCEVSVFLTPKHLLLLADVANTWTVARAAAAASTLASQTDVSDSNAAWASSSSVDGYFPSFTPAPVETEDAKPQGGWRVRMASLVVHLLYTHPLSPPAAAAACQLHGDDLRLQVVHLEACRRRGHPFPERSLTLHRVSLVERLRPLVPTSPDAQPHVRDILSFHHQAVVPSSPCCGEQTAGVHAGCGVMSVGALGRIGVDPPSDSSHVLDSTQPPGAGALHGQRGPSGVPAGGPGYGCSFAEREQTMDPADVHCVFSVADAEDDDNVDNVPLDGGARLARDPGRDGGGVEMVWALTPFVLRLDTPLLTRLLALGRTLRQGLAQVRGHTEAAGGASCTTSTTSTSGAAFGQSAASRVEQMESNLLRQLGGWHAAASGSSRSRGAAPSAAYGGVSLVTAAVPWCRVVLVLPPAPPPLAALREAVVVDIVEVSAKAIPPGSGRGGEECEGLEVCTGFASLQAHVAGLDSGTPRCFLHVTPPPPESSEHLDDQTNGNPSLTLRFNHASARGRGSEAGLEHLEHLTDKVSGLDSERLLLDLTQDSQLSLYAHCPCASLHLLPLDPSRMRWAIHSYTAACQSLQGNASHHGGHRTPGPSDAPPMFRTTSLGAQPPGLDESGGSVYFDAVSTPVQTSAVFPTFPGSARKQFQSLLSVRVHSKDLKVSMGQTEPEAGGVSVPGPLPLLRFRDLRGLHVVRFQGVQRTVSFLDADDILVTAASSSAPATSPASPGARWPIPSGHLPVLERTAPGLGTDIATVAATLVEDKTRSGPVVVTAGVTLRYLTSSRISESGWPAALSAFFAPRAQFGVARGKAVKFELSLDEVALIHAPSDAPAHAVVTVRDATVKIDVASASLVSTQSIQVRQATLFLRPKPNFEEDIQLPVGLEFDSDDTRPESVFGQQGYGTVAVVENLDVTVTHTRAALNAADSAGGDVAEEPQDTAGGGSWQLSSNGGLVEMTTSQDSLSALVSLVMFHVGDGAPEAPRPDPAQPETDSLVRLADSAGDSLSSSAAPGADSTQDSWLSGSAEQGKVLGESADTPNEPLGTDEATISLDNSPQSDADERTQRRAAAAVVTMSQEQSWSGRGGGGINRLASMETSSVGGDGWVLAEDEPESDDSDSGPGAGGLVRRVYGAGVEVHDKYFTVEHRDECMAREQQEAREHQELSVTVSGLQIQWHICMGSLWRPKAPAPWDVPAHSPAETTSAKDSKPGRVSLCCRGVGFDFNTFDDTNAGNLAATASFCVHDFFINETVSKGGPAGGTMLLSLLDSTPLPREAADPMIHLRLHLLRPDSPLLSPRSSACSGDEDEASSQPVGVRVMVHVLPVRLQLAGEVAALLGTFFGPISELVVLDGPPQMFDFHLFEVAPLQLRLDYIPFTDSPAAQGTHVKFLNLLPLKNIDITLGRVRLPLQGHSPLMEAGVLLSCVKDLWQQHVLLTQLYKVASGLPLLRNAAHLGTGAMELVQQPLLQMRKDGRLLRGVSRGTALFLKAVTTEAVDATCTVASQMSSMVDVLVNGGGGPVADQVSEEEQELVQVLLALQNASNVGQRMQARTAGAGQHYSHHRWSAAGVSRSLRPVAGITDTVAQGLLGHGPATSPWPLHPQRD